ncbi:MAG: ABC transporter permease, partial [Proteobacteria bacterium]|nr:ABC transporter permease [Pseudomonadota bacterium]
FPVSVTDQRYLSLPKHGISFQHYANIVANEFWWSSIVQSVFVASISTAITVVLGTMVTVGCWRLSTRTSELVRALMLLPMIVPSVIHALGFFRMWIDLDLLDTFVGVIATHVITSLPYVVITVSTALANFDVRLEQAARNLGASLGQTMRLVIVPCILPGVVTGGIFAFVHAWDELVVVLFITSRKVYLLPRAIWDGINENVDPTIAAIATLLIAVTLVGVLIERIAKLRVAPKAEDDAAAAASLRPGAVAVASD